MTEEAPIACWGERGLLNAAGELFLPDADHVPAELPRLHGPAGTEGAGDGALFQRAASSSSIAAWRLSR